MRTEAKIQEWLWCALTDIKGNWIESRDPLGRRTTYVYDSVDRRIATVDPLGNRWSTVYDTQGRVIASVNPLGERTTTIYDVFGRVVAMVDAKGNRTSYTYDAVRGLQLAVQNALGHRTS